MAEFVVEKEIEADVESAWNVIADFGGLTWVPGIESCEVEGGPGVGQVRTVMAGPVEIQERLESFDPEARSLSYSIVKGPIPVENYLATVTLADAGSGRTLARWGARFDTPGLDDEAAKGVAAGVESSYAGMVDALAVAPSK